MVRSRLMIAPCTPPHALRITHHRIPATRQGYRKYGFNREGNATVYREWAPGATAASLIGDFNGWNPSRRVGCCDRARGVQSADVADSRFVVCAAT